MRDIDRTPSRAHSHRAAYKDIAGQLVYVMERALVLVGLPEALMETVRMCLMVYVPSVGAMRKLLYNQNADRCGPDACTKGRSPMIK